MRRFVFVPLAGSNTGADWIRHPHLKAWGFIESDEELNFTAIHLEGDDPVMVGCLPIGEPCSIFDAEIAQAVDIPEGSTDLPDAVCVALAKMAMLPVSPAN